MGAQARVEIPVDLMAEILRALEHCSQDLEVEISDRYSQESRDKYPSYARRFKNDMEPVMRAQKALQDVRAERWWPLIT